MLLGMQAHPGSIITAARPAGPVRIDPGKLEINMLTGFAFADNPGQHFLVKGRER
jgi:hypothetical protein